VEVVVSNLWFANYGLELGGGSVWKRVEVLKIDGKVVALRDNDVLIYNQIIQTFLNVRTIDEGGWRMQQHNMAKMQSSC
jgi:hypothetical protein